MLPSPVKTRSTQKDIAKALGISQATVAIALSAKTRWKLTPEMVAQVQAKAREMNYTPQRQASILRSGRSHIIGVVFLSGVFHAPQERVKCLARAAIRAGYQLIAADLDWFDRDLKAVADYLMGAAAEGVILCNLPGGLMNEWYEVADLEPTVNISAGIRGKGDNLYGDLKEAFRQITQHHLELGSQRLQLLLPYQEFSREEDTPLLGVPVEQRLDGFLEAMKEAGATVVSSDRETARLLGVEYTRTLPRKGIVGQVAYPAKAPEVNSALELGAWFIHSLGAGHRQLPDSLICSNDNIAAGVLQACQELEIKVPGQIRISGADDAPFSLYCGTPITTISHGPKEMADYAIERIVSLIENPDLRANPVARAFPCSIIPRASTLGHKSEGSTMKRKVRCEAFSLMELLVGLAIVTILSILALTAVQGVRRKGDDARCIANLRSSGLALLTYLNDNNGRFLPKKYWFQYSSYRASTNRGMREYFNVEADSNAGSPSQEIDTVLTCPSMIRHYPALRNTMFRRGFGINYFLFRTDGDLAVNSFKTLQAVPNLSAMWAFTDGAVDGGASNPAARGLLGSVNNHTAYHQGNYIPYPHSGGVNHFFFLDGHVKGITKEGLREFTNSRDFWGNTALTE